MYDLKLKSDDELKKILEECRKNKDYGCVQKIEEILNSRNIREMEQHMLRTQEKEKLRKAEEELEEWIDNIKKDDWSMSL